MRRWAYASASACANRFPPSHLDQIGEEKMQVILLERVPKLGQMGETVRVRDGFARNFLLPRGKALRATEATRSGLKISAPNSKRAISSAARMPRRFWASSKARPTRSFGQAGEARDHALCVR
jgi:hypothetical protein